MLEKSPTLGTISRLLSYPDSRYAQMAEMLYVIVQSELPDAARGISEFGQFVEGCDGHALEEVYTRTFDVNPSCALEVGWHLFGEDYIRGQFLVRMRQELVRYEIPETSELPDHLTHVLAVLAAMPQEEAGPFVHSCVFPALAKMQKSLDENKSPYRHLIHALVLVLEHLHGPGQAWTEEEARIPRNTDTHPGQNGPRAPGQGDPLRAYPLPGAPCGGRQDPDGSHLGTQNGHVELVPLQMKYQAPGNRPLETQDYLAGRKT